LKRDLEFATSEIERLRAKLVVKDEQMPALFEELTKNNQTRDRSIIIPRGARDNSTADIAKP
jgi:hypothetical protein